MQIIARDLSIIAGIVALALITAGCGGDATSATVATETTESTATAVPTTAPTVVPTGAPIAAATTTPTPVPADATPAPEFNREDSIQLLLDGGLDKTQAACITDGGYEISGSWNLRAEVASTMEEELAAMAFACIGSESAPTAEPIQDLSTWLSDAGTLPPAERLDLYPGSPPVVVAAGVDYEAVITTPDGEMRFDLFASEAPITVNSFLNLASDGYFDNVTFHRVIDEFMAQGGDPTGTGGGGPGYQFVNEYTPGIEFDQRGRLAMANAGPNTNGSQFFITYAPLDFLAAADYTIFGQLVDGDDTLAAIEMRDPASATAPGTTITSIRVTGKD